MSRHTQSKKKRWSWKLVLFTMYTSFCTQRFKHGALVQKMKSKTITITSFFFFFWRKISWRCSLLPLTKFWKVRWPFKFKWFCFDWCLWEMPVGENFVLVCGTCLCLSFSSEIWIESTTEFCASSNRVTEFTEWTWFKIHWTQYNPVQAVPAVLLDHRKQYYYLINELEYLKAKFLITL